MTITGAISPPTENGAIDAAARMAADLISNLLKNTVETYWQIGALVNQLTIEYGNGAVKEFGVRLADLVGRQEGFSDSTLYRAARFQSNFDEKAVADITKNKISWTQVVKALPHNPNIVKQCVKRVESGEVEPAKFGDAVIRMVEGDGNPTESKSLQEMDTSADPGELRENVASLSTGPEIVADSNPDESPIPSPALENTGSEPRFDKELAKIVDRLNSSIEELGSAILLLDRFKKLPEDQKAQFADGVRELVETIKNLAQSGGQVKVYLTELGFFK